LFDAVVDGFPSTMTAGGLWVPAFAGTTTIRDDASASPQIQFLEEVVALVINDEAGKPPWFLQASRTAAARLPLSAIAGILPKIVRIYCHNLRPLAET
jgi:hypothetical protein